MKTGTERFHRGNSELDFDLLSFWQWSGSDILSNTLRGTLAEFIVGQALGCLSNGRVEWDDYDLQTTSGYKVEVKSSAYLQSWDQEKPSIIQFNIKPSKMSKMSKGSPSRGRRCLCILSPQ